MSAPTSTSSCAEAGGRRSFSPGRASCSRPTSPRPVRAGATAASLKALDTSVDNRASRPASGWSRKGFEGVLARQYNPALGDDRGSSTARPRRRLIALTCSPPPKGRAKWTLRLLEDKVVELNIVERASDNTIGRTLKKTTLKPHLKKQWVIPPEANAAFVANMEDVLEVYTRPHDPNAPSFAWTRPRSNWSPKRDADPGEAGRPARVRLRV